MNRFYTTVVLSALILFGLRQEAHAQFEEGKQDITLMPLIGSGIATGANNTISYSNQGEISSLTQIKNIITLRIDEQSTIFPLSAFTAQVNFTVDARATVSPQSALQTTTNSLTVNYDPATGAKYNVRAYLALDQMQEVKITVNSITISGQTGSWTPISLLRLENEMRVLRYYQLSYDASVLTPTFNSPVNNTDALAVSWSWNTATNNNISQLEWAWVEDDMAGFYTQSGVLNTDNLFQTNSTRVDLNYGDNLFKIPLLYPGSGKLYYRVRAALRKNDQNIIAAPWSAVQSFTFGGHEINLNWQSSTSFAEDGKYKSVIQYFDGSLRSRQTVTKDNETGNTIVGETIYDLQGRPNVQILPTPTIDNVIQYFTNFNRFSGQTDGTDPANFFDLTPAAVKCSASPALDITKGNGRYYSANNDWLATENKSKFIPDAQGYAYTETRFMDDATERVAVQGGVGINHQIGTGHETKYFYGKPGQQELDALFGTEVGDASHYSKNMVQDANGQMSVSYTDMHGRTIATALAGQSPANLVSIANSTDYPQASGLLTNQLLTPATNIIKDNTIESINTLLVPASTDYNFSYALNPAVVSQYSPVANRQICFDCKYNLEISIRPEDCSGAAPIVKKYSNLQIVPADQACGTPMGFIGEGITVPTNQISFTQTLGTGSWVVRKTLTINDSLFSIRKDSALKVFLVKTQQNLQDSIYNSLVTVSGCGLPAGNTSVCDSCKAHLGTYSQYKINYLTAIGNPAGYDTSTIHIQYTQDSLNCAEACGHSSNLSTLASLRNQMLLDMTPFTGQYAIDPLFDHTTGLSTAFSSSDEQSKYNIFSNTPAVSGKIKPFYRNPVTETGTASKYYTADNVIDPSMLDVNGNSVLDTITVFPFGNRFQTSWANSLIYYHPEFSKLKFAETNLASSYAWLDKVQFTTSYAQAQSFGYNDPVNSDPFFVGNSGINYKSTIQQYISSYVPAVALNSGTTIGPNNTASIWQIANAVVLCAGTSDAQRNSCALNTTRTGMDSRITNSSDQDKVWQRFISTYLSYRNEMLVKYINSQSNVLSASSMSALQIEGKQLVFATAQDIATQNGAGGYWSIAASGDTTHLTDSVNAYITRNNLGGDKCIAQRPVWATMLTQCEQLMNLLNKKTVNDSATVNAIINTILDSMVMVCHQSQTSLQPYGASTVNPSFTGKPKSFEEIIDVVFSQNGIVTNVADSNYFCNPFTITNPKPYGTNTPLFVNYSNQIDSCGCSRFAQLKQEAAGLGAYNTTTLAGMNQFLSANYQDTLSLTVWQGLQSCSSMFSDTCNLTTLNTREQHELAGPSNYGDVTMPDTSSSCIVYTPITLGSYVAIPAFLSCGYVKPCITCSQLTALTTEFKSLFPFYNNVPHTDSIITDAQIQENSLWARFLNYRTGFSLNALDYLSAMQSCANDSAHVITMGNGSDCGPSSAVDTLLVNARLTPYYSQYDARLEVVFQGEFESTTTDEFETVLNSSYSSCMASGIAGTPVSGTSSNSAEALCANTKPLNDISFVEPAATACAQTQTQAQFIAQQMFGKLKDSLTANFDSLYVAKCLNAQSAEQFYATYQPKEYHYTLYYYDQAGNLLKTLPPAAVQPNYDPTYLANIATQRSLAADVVSANNELMATQYRYNTLNQVISQHTPDAGNSLFWYDRLGRLVISQNSSQAAFNGYYSYTKYDLLGRITEVGQYGTSTPMTQSISQDTIAMQTWFHSGGAVQITATVYDNLYYGFLPNSDGPTIFSQQNLRNRVSYTMVFDGESRMGYLPDGSLSGGNSATYYSYDIHGNVDTLLQDYNQLVVVEGDRFKKIGYSYDLISGKVNDVGYQPGQADQFYHHYNYDAENRLVNVRTSRDKIYWETDASYDYYRHGPLDRTVIGQNQVQGIDYAYTIQGWLKGVNSNYTFDMGQDGSSGSGTTTSRDAYGYQLNYFNGDYQPVNASSTNFAGVPSTLPSSSAGANLFNGNISSMLLNLPSVGSGVPYLYGYQYDQLNRISAMDAFAVVTSTGNTISPVSTLDYQERISYDPNGNLKTYLRNGTTQGGAAQNMDNLTYQYERNSNGKLVSNKLRYIQDQVADANYSNDIDNQTSLTLSQVQADNNSLQSSDNYNYEPNGNLRADKKAGIQNITWTAYGKISTIAKSDNSFLSYYYDGSGNRIAKFLEAGNTSTRTLYVRDASGNVMSVYTSVFTTGSNSPSNGENTQSEIDLYGSSRLGIYNTNLDVQAATSSPITTFTRGNKFFELTNHLGNVLSTVSDKKIAVDQNSDGSIDYYNADVVTANDYYPFGMQMPGRSFEQTNSSYRYGFNGKENDNELKGPGDQLDYGMRIYDPRAGRFLSVDPLASKYPELTSYQFTSNSPIENIDLDGAEAKKYEINHYESYDSKGRLLTSNTKTTEVKVIQNAWTAMANFYNRVTGGDVKTGTSKVYTVTIDKLDKNGSPFKPEEKTLFEYYTPGQNDTKRGGLYLVSKEGGYGHSDGDLSGSDATPIDVDLLVSLFEGMGGSSSVGLGGAASQEEKVEKIFVHFFGGTSLEKNASKLEIVTDFLENMENANHNTIEGITALKELLKQGKLPESNQPLKLGPGSDSCTVCEKVEPADSMNHHIDDNKNYHGKVVRTKGTNEVQPNNNP